MEDVIILVIIQILSLVIVVLAFGSYFAAKSMPKRYPIVTSAEIIGYGKTQSKLFINYTYLILRFVSEGATHVCSFERFYCTPPDEYAIGNHIYIVHKSGEPDKIRLRSQKPNKGLLLTGTLFILNIVLSGIAIRMYLT